MVLSNKKLKQKLREAKSEILLASQSQNNSSIQNLLFSENPSAKAQESVQSLLKTSAQIPRLSKREKRREKIESFGEKSESFGEKSEYLGEKIEYLGENVDVLGGNEVRKGRVKVGLRVWKWMGR
ncbi:hypothetical protein Leryth_008641 [Lithospermum erythrorhizon]|nr:hypothetical protein Leryth_008641 [Lithospermum erythrorhizon]